MQIHIRGKSPQEGGRQSREMQISVHRMESGEERGRWAPSRFPRKTTEGRGRSSGGEEPDTGQGGTAGEDEPRGPQGRGDREIQTEREKKKEKRVISRPGRHP